MKTKTKLNIKYYKILKHKIPASSPIIPEYNHHSIDCKVIINF